MWLSSSILYLFLLLGCISASQTSLFAPRGRAKPKDVLLRTIASTTGTTKDDGPPLKPFPQTLKDDGPIKLFTQTIKDARRHLAAAGIARCISIFAMYPVDTIKVRNDIIPKFSKCDGILLARTNAGGACRENEGIYRYLVSPMRNLHLISSLFLLFVCSNIATLRSVKLDSNADGTSESLTDRWNLQWRIGIVGGTSPLRVSYVTLRVLGTALCRLLSSPIPLYIYIMIVYTSHSHYCLLFVPRRHSVLTFGSYEMYKRTLMNKFPNVKPIFVYAAAAIMGDLTGSGWLCPSEVVKQKMQAGMFKTTGEAVSSIWKQKGLVGLYEGYFGGIARDVPFRVAQLTTYELTKNLYLRIKTRRFIAADEQKKQSSKQGKQTKNEQPDVQLTAVETAICGGVAGSFSAAITAPLDRFKTLLMTDSAAYGGNVASCAAQLWKKEGIRGFTTGVVPRVVYIAPSVVIFFIAYEQVQQRLQHWQ
jgi:hypothetical protein